MHRRDEPSWNPLPSNVMGAIFWAVTEIPSSREDIWDSALEAQTLTATAAVCREWRLLALSLPQRWAKTVNVDTQSLASFRKFIERCKGVPFHVYSSTAFYSHSYIQEPDVWAAIVANFSCSETLYIHTHPPGDSLLVDLRLIGLLLRTNAPFLRNIHIAQRNAASRTVASCRGSPSQALLDFTALSPFSALTSLVVRNPIGMERDFEHNPVEYCLLILRRLPNLRIFRAFNVIHTPEYVSPDSCLDCRSSTPVRSEHLAELQLSGNTVVEARLAHSLGVPPCMARFSPASSGSDDDLNIERLDGVLRVFLQSTRAPGGSLGTQGALRQLDITHSTKVLSEYS